MWKGKHLPGHYGTDKMTVQNLTVVGIEPEQNVLLVSGAVPGHADGLLFVNTAVEGPAAPEAEAGRARAREAEGLAPSRRAALDAPLRETGARSAFWGAPARARQVGRVGVGVP